MKALNSSGELKVAADYGDVPDWFGGVFCARLARDSATQLSLKRENGQYVFVTGEFVDPGSGGLTITTTDNRIDSAGADAGAALTTSTLYYVYVSNSKATFAPLGIRLSTVAPSLYKGAYYLGTSGNAANWRHVGWVRTNGSTQFVDDTTDRLVINRYNQRRLPILLQPGYNDNDSATSYTISSTTWAAVNGGTGATASYISDGINAVSFQAAGNGDPGASAVLAFGIGDNSTTSAYCEATSGTAARLHSGLSMEKVQSEGYFTVSLLAYRATANGTMLADSPRNGSAADPRRTYLTGIVMG